MTQHRYIRSRVTGAAAGALLVAFAAACNFDVSNPGPVQDDFLSDTNAFSAEVNGMGRQLGGALNFIALQGGVVAREIFPTGQTGQFGVEPNNMAGLLIPDEQGDPWSNAQQARWLAEHGLERFKTALGDKFASHPLVAQAQLWAGFANRMLGENMCQAVFDGGAPQASTEYLKRAEQYFTSAIATENAAIAANAKGANVNVVTAAYAGRAAVRVQLGDWTGAVADAAKVPTTFNYTMPYYDIGDEYQYNRVYWSSTSQSINKAHSVWNTAYEAYENATKDPRISFTVTTQKGNGSVEGVGPVPWYPQTKFTSKSSASRLTSGREMRLIEAENALRNGDWQGAMTTINAVRAAAGASAATATNATEAWTVLKRERGVEMWLEGRRLGDLRRWKASNTPGDLSPLEVPSATSYLKSQDLCFPLSRAEIDLNPNVPKT